MKAIIYVIYQLTIQKIAPKSYLLNWYHAKFLNIAKWLEKNEKDGLFRIVRIFYFLQDEEVGVIEELEENHNNSEQKTISSPSTMCYQRLSIQQQNALLSTNLIKENMLVSGNQICTNAAAGY